MARRLFWHIFPSFSFLALLSILVIAVLATAFFRSFHYDNVSEELSDITAILGTFITEEIFTDPEAAVAFCNRASGDTDIRTTIVLWDGTVIGDSHQDSRIMDNHGNRPEIRAAMQSGTGRAIRKSATLGYTMIYAARAIVLPEGSACVFRAAKAVEDIDALLSVVSGRITIATAVVIVGVSLASLGFARSVSAPLSALRESAVRIANGDDTTPPRFASPEEVRSLSEAFTHMSTQLSTRFETIITQRNELQAILSGMLEAVIVLNRDLSIREMNAAAERLIGLGSSSAAGKNLLEVFRNSALYDLACRVLNEGGPIESTISVFNHFSTARAWTLDGRYRQDETSFLQVHGILLAQSGTQEYREGVLLVLNDITRLIKLENIRKDFVANVSHELKTPITSIKGFVETLLEGALEDKENASRFLNIIDKHTDRLMNIIEDLLSLSRLERDDRDTEFRPSNVRAVISEAVQVCLEKAAERSIKIAIDCSEELSADMNPLLIEQAVVNLVDNAIKYSEHNSVVTVRCYTSGETVKIVVSDSGCGIPSKDIPRIFERFYRVDKARSRELGGTGLGLAIVKHIILEHGGSVEVDSAIDEGSVFTLNLPQKRKGRPSE